MCAARRSDKSYQKNYKAKTAKETAKADAHCAVIIQFPHEDQAKKLEKNMSKDAPDPKVYKKFDIDRKGNLLSIHIHDIHDTAFCGAFLLAVGASVKELVVAANEEAMLSLRFQGKDEAGAAVCVASHGLWPAEFSFSNEAEKEKFDAARVTIDTQIKAVTKEAMPHLKKELENLKKKFKIEGKNQEKGKKESK
jgi:hypothetical protein